MAILISLCSDGFCWEVHSSLKNFFWDASMVPVLNLAVKTVDSITESPEFTFDKTQKFNTKTVLLGSLNYLFWGDNNANVS